MKIGILIDHKQPIPLCFHDFLQNGPKFFELTLLVQHVPRLTTQQKLARSITQPRKKLTSLIWQTFHSIERTLLTRFTQHTFSRPLSTFPLADAPTFHLTPIISHSRYIYTYSESDLDTIKQLNLEAIILIGSGIIQGPLLSIPKHGIISFHHGDPRFFRGGPPGFWEIIFQFPYSQYILQRLSPVLDGGNVLTHGSITTTPLHSLNLYNLHRESQFALIPLLLSLSSTSYTTASVTSHLYLNCNPLYRSPTLSSLFKYLFILTSFVLIRLFRRLLMKRFQWNIFLGTDPRHSPFDSLSRIQMPANYGCADPFILSINSKTLCFYELIPPNNQPGRIAFTELALSPVSKSKSKVQPINPTTIIAEEYHLSFPCPFVHKGSIYILPEAVQSGQLTAYNVDLTRNCVIEKHTLLPFPCAEPLIFEHNNKWWLFVNLDIYSTGNYSTLHIFYSDSPLSRDWIPHQQNPQRIDPRFSRNGGFYRHNGFLYRVSQQQGFAVYGRAQTHHRIAVLNENVYAEERHDFLGYSRNLPFHTHHFSYDKGFFAIDANLLV